MLTYWLLRIGLLFGRMPKAIGYPFSSLIGLTAYYLAASTRATVKSNLAVVLGPNASRSALDSKAREVFRNIGRNYYDMVRLPRTKPDELAKDVEIRWDYLDEAIASGKGIIVASAHIGSFDLVIQISGARGIHFTLVTEPLLPEKLFKFVADLRSSQGHRAVSSESGGLRDVVKTLRGGGIVAITCDRTFNGIGEKTMFMGRETLLPIGAVELAARTGSVIVPAVNFRTNGTGKFAAYFEQPIYFAAGTSHESIEYTHKHLTSRMEDWIRRHPEQWVVTSKVWPELPSK